MARRRRRSRVAYGAMVFIHEHPQILLSADENKVELCLFIADGSGPREGQMTIEARPSLGVESILR